MRSQARVLEQRLAVLGLDEGLCGDRPISVAELHVAVAKRDRFSFGLRLELHAEKEALRVRSPALSPRALEDAPHPQEIARAARLLSD